LSTVRLSIPIEIYLTSDALKGAVPGVQVFQLCVQADCGVSEDHYVIDAQYHCLVAKMRQAVATYLRQSAGECVVSFILVDLPGKAEVVSAPLALGLFAPAAAVAVVKAACGWDESNPIIIKINNSEVAIHLNHDDGSWVATCPSSPK